MLSLRPKREKFSAAALGALGGAAVGTLVGGSVGAGLGGFVAGAEGESLAYHVGACALLFACSGMLFGAPLGAVSGLRFRRRHGVPPRMRVIRLTVLERWGSSLAWALRGAVAGGLFGVPFGLLNEASVVGGVVGKSHGGNAGGVLGLAIGGSACAALLLAGFAVLGGKARWHRFRRRTANGSGEKRAPGPLTRAARGGLMGGVAGLVIAGVYVLPMLATEPARFLDLGTETAAAMAWGCVLCGFALGALRDAILALSPQPNRPWPARPAGLPPGQPPLPS